MVCVLSLMVKAQRQGYGYSRMVGFEVKTRYAEGGIRPGLFVAVRGRPPSGSWSGVLFTDICDCTLKSIGVPVNFPVKSS